MNIICTNILCKTEHSPGALTANQDKVGDDIHSTETIKWHMNTWSHTLHFLFVWRRVTEGYSLWCPVHSLVSLYEFSYRVAIKKKGAITGPEHIKVYTCKQTHKYAHAQVYSHKCEHGHNGCGDEQLRCQNQIHLENKTHKPSEHYSTRVRLS